MADQFDPAFAAFALRELADALDINPGSDWPTTLALATALVERVRCQQAATPAEHHLQIAVSTFCYEVLNHTSRHNEAFAARIFGEQVELPKPPSAEMARKIAERLLPTDVAQQAKPLRAQQSKLFPKGLDGISYDIQDLIVKLQSERDEKTDIDIAREIFKKDDVAKRMLGRVRALRQSGKTTLPARA